MAATITHEHWYSLNPENGLLSVSFALLLGSALNTDPVWIISVVFFVRNAIAVIMFDTRAVAACESSNVVEAGQKLGLDSN